MDYSNSKSPAPTAPPYPPPPPPHPKFEYPMTATGIPVNMNPIEVERSKNNYSTTDHHHHHHHHPNRHATITVHSHSPISWSSSLCDCFSDIHTCCLTCWCPCITFGRIAEVVDRGSTSCGVSAALYMLIMCMTGCSCLYSCFYRTKLRGQYFLKESPCTDCCTHCCCEQCALCQEYRELKHHGLDMSIGWHGNMQRQKRLAALSAPTVQGGMTRSP